MRHLFLSMGLIAIAACSAATDGDRSERLQEEAMTRPEVQTLEDRFAILALDCIHREYPNKISHVLQSADDANPPRALTPIFYGCFDWHSSVHGHWLLTRMLATQSDSVLSDEIRLALAESFTDEKLAGELAYYNGPGRASFERPYGIAWYLQLIAELEESEDPQLQTWRETL